MSIIFYEYNYAQDLINNGVDRIFQRDLNILAKYWNYLRYPLSEISLNLESFCLENDKNFNIVQNYELIHRSLNYSRLNILRFPTPIAISKGELDIIGSLNDYNREKFLFAMLVAARFFKLHPSRKILRESKYDHVLYSNSSIKDLKELAEVRFTKKEWKVMKHELTKSGLISPTIMRKSCWAIGFENRNSEAGIVIDDYRNIVAYYQEHAGERIINCEVCGVKIARRSNRHKMCKRCWYERNKELKRNWWNKNH